jgi:hypothetical protein
VLAVVLLVFSFPLQWIGRAAELPQRRKQVPREWLLWPSKSATAFGFGLLIGAGWLTPLRFAAAYVLAAMLLLAPTITAAIVVGLSYGAARGLVLLATWISDRTTGTRPPWDAWASSTRLDHVVAIAMTLSLAAAVFAAVSGVNGL